MICKNCVHCQVGMLPYIPMDNVQDMAYRCMQPEYDTMIEVLPDNLCSIDKFKPRRED